MKWNPRCSDILRCMAGHYRDSEIAARIQGETGMRFTAETIGDYRRCAGLPRYRRNDWSGPLRRAKAA